MQKKAALRYVVCSSHLDPWMRISNYQYLFRLFSYNWKYHIWVNYNDLTVLPNPEIMINKGNHPQMALH